MAKIRTGENRGRRPGAGRQVPQPQASELTPATADDRTSAIAAAAARMDKPTRDEIARRAYELFVARGGRHGYDIEDWLQAERELRGR